MGSTDYDGSFDNADEESGRSTVIIPSQRLNSAAMRKYIVTALDFEASEETFETGGVKRPVFFHKKEDGKPTKRTYIALANNRDPGDRESQTSGEQSISIVLQTIKDDLGSHKGMTRILIPLQQIGKEHWTLLTITS